MCIVKFRIERENVEKKLLYSSEACQMICWPPLYYAALWQEVLYENLLMAIWLVYIQSSC